MGCGCGRWCSTVPFVVGRQRCTSGRRITTPRRHGEIPLLNTRIGFRSFNSFPLLPLQPYLNTRCQIPRSAGSTCGSQDAFRGNGCEPAKSALDLEIPLVPFSDYPYVHCWTAGDAVYTDGLGCFGHSSYPGSEVGWVG